MSEKHTITLELPAEFYKELHEQAKKVFMNALSEARRDAGITKEYLTPQECMNMLGVSNNTFTNNFIEAGLPIYKIEQKRYIKKSELYSFIQSHKIH